MPTARMVTFLAALLPYWRSLTVNAYYISLPIIAVAIGTDARSIKLTVSLFFFGAALAKFISGSVISHLGLHNTLRLVLIIFLTGTFICIIADNVVLIGIGRFLQAISVGSAPVIATSMLAEMPERKHSVTFSYYHAFNLLASPFAFIVGGYIVYFLNWRFVFVFMFVFALFVGAAVLFFMPPERQHEAKMHHDFSNYLTLLKHWRLNAWIWINAMIWSIFNIYFLGMTYLLSVVLHINVHYVSWLTSSIVVSQWVGLFLAIKLVKQFKDSFLIIAGIAMVLLGIITLLCLAVFSAVSVMSLVLPGIICAIGMALTFGPLNNKILQQNPLLQPSYVEAYAGTALSIMSMLGTFSLALFRHATALPVAITILIMLVIASLLLFFTLQKSH